MEKFVAFNGQAAALDLAHVDTDQIIPKQFLKLVERSGFGEYLFFNHRYLDDGTLNPEFVLNLPRFDGASILVARENFGCGSSREHAPWALMDYGFKVLIAPSFADIFRNNCYKNGILPVVLDAELVDELFRHIESTDGYSIDVDLEDQTLTGSDGWSCSFDVDPFHKRCLLEGLDEISLTLEEHQQAIAAYESGHREPWLIPETTLDIGGTPS